MWRFPVVRIFISLKRNLRFLWMDVFGMAARTAAIFPELIVHFGGPKLSGISSAQQNGTACFEGKTWSSSIFGSVKSRIPSFHLCVGWSVALTCVAGSKVIRRAFFGCFPQKPARIHDRFPHSD